MAFNYWRNFGGLDVDNEFAMSMEYPGEFNYQSYNWQGQGPGRNMRGGWGGFNQGPPPNFSHPGYSWGRGFGPNGPPIVTADNNAFRYLLRCGVPKDKVKSLPKDLLQSITPEHCYLCEISLENFSLSRAHYVSKGHLRKQNNWLAQNNVQKFKRPNKESPLSPRAVYCELCDVLITSPAHADSHYSGKPHRAVVEGKKPPKNTSLLKKDMTARVEQLIRREKKALRSLPTPEEAQEQAAAAKPVQPELYCEICKTSVTCSEQMRMHLNGKKHLAKEKQHILKVMTGETDVNDAEQKADEESTADKEKEEGQKDEDTDANYDWGNGSGTWDDDPQ